MDYYFVKSKATGQDTLGTVYARVSSGHLNKKYGIGLTIREIEWNKYRAMNYNSSAMMNSIGIKYGQFVTLLTQIKVALEDNFNPTTAPTIIRTLTSRVINGPKPIVKAPPAHRKVMLDDYMSEYIEHLRSGQRTKRGFPKLVSPGYLRNMRSLLNTIKRYERERNKTLALDDITLQFQRDYVKWCMDRGVGRNTIANQLSDIRTVMIAAFTDKKTRCNDCRLPDFVPQRQEVDHIYLNNVQIQQMLDFDLTDQPQLAISRDIFIIGCLTGQRVSDYSRISADMVTQIEDRQFLHVVQQKTGKTVYIPLDSRVLTLLAKYNNVLPPVKYKTLWRNIKLIAEMMHWTQPVDIDPSLMGNRTKTRFCDLLGTHTARRSFATNAYASGVPLSSIMAVTGHATEEMLRRYLRLQAKEKALIAAHDFESFIQ